MYSALNPHGNARSFDLQRIQNLEYELSTLKRECEALKRQNERLQETLDTLCQQIINNEVPQVPSLCRNRAEAITQALRNGTGGML